MVTPCAPGWPNRPQSKRVADLGQSTGLKADFGASDLGLTICAS